MLSRTNKTKGGPGAGLKGGKNICYRVSGYELAIGGSGCEQRHRACSASLHDERAGIAGSSDAAHNYLSAERDGDLGRVPALCWNVDENGAICG